MPAGALGVDTGLLGRAALMVATMDEGAVALEIACGCATACCVNKGDDG